MLIDEYLRETSTIVPQGMARCKCCSRTFQKDRLVVHEKSCIESKKRMPKSSKPRTAEQLYEKEAEKREKHRAAQSEDSARAAAAKRKKEEQRERDERQKKELERSWSTAWEPAPVTTPPLYERLDKI